MTTLDHTDAAECVVTLGHVPNVLPELFEAQRRLEHLHENLRSLHYGLCAFMVRHGHSAADDLALTVETAHILRDLDDLRDDLAACRRRLTLGDRP